MSGRPPAGAAARWRRCCRGDGARGSCVRGRRPRRGASPPCAGRRRRACRRRCARRSERAGASIRRSLPPAPPATRNDGGHASRASVTTPKGINTRPSAPLAASPPSAARPGLAPTRRGRRRGTAPRARPDWIASSASPGHSRSATLGVVIAPHGDHLGLRPPFTPAAAPRPAAAAPARSSGSQPFGHLVGVGADAQVSSVRAGAQQDVS